MDDLEEWMEKAEKALDSTNEIGYTYCIALLDWRTGKLNSALKYFNLVRQDPEWGQTALMNMIEICLNPQETILTNDSLDEQDINYEDSNGMALNTAQRLLKDLDPKGNPKNVLAYNLLTNFFLLATKQKMNIEQALRDFTKMAGLGNFQDHVGPIMGMAMAHILLNQMSRAKNHLKRVSRNVWTFENAYYLEGCWLLLAELHETSNKNDQAIELLKRVIEHNATCVAAQEMLGKIAEKEQHYKEAAVYYGLAWKYGGRFNLAIGYKLAYCSMKCKAYSDAIQACIEVLQQNPDFPKLRKEILEKSINNIRT